MPDILVRGFPQNIFISFPQLEGETVCAKKHVLAEITAQFPGSRGVGALLYFISSSSHLVNDTCY